MCIRDRDQGGRFGRGLLETRGAGLTKMNGGALDSRQQIHRFRQEVSAGLGQAVEQGRPGTCGRAQTVEKGHELSLIHI